MMTDELRDQSISFGTVGNHVLERVVAPARATRVRLLVGVERRIDEEPVLEIVDPDLDRFLVGDGAQVTGNLETAPVCCLDGRAQFLARNVRVRLERGHAAIRPKFDGLSSILRTRECANLEITTRPIQIGAGHVQMWARKRAFLNGPLQFKVRIGRGTPGRAHGRDTVRQI